MIKLLIVDDEPVERDAIRLIVNTSLPNIKVVGEANNGFDAIKLFNQLNPDIVVIDIQMPGMNGLEAIQEMLKGGSRVKFIIVTSHSKFEYAQSAVKLGVKDFLLKPTGVDELIATLTKLTGEIEESKREDDTKKNFEEKISDIQKLLHNEFFVVVKKGIYNEELSRIFNLLQTPFHAGCVYLLKGKGITRLIVDRILLQIKRMGFREFNDYSATETTLVIVNSDSSKKLVHTTLGDYLESYLQSLGIYDIFIAVGSLETNSAALPLSYKQAHRLAEQNGNEHLYEELNIKEEGSNRELLPFLDKIVPVILACNWESAQLLLKEYDTTLKSDDPLLLSLHYHQVGVMIKQRIAQDLRPFTLQQEELLYKMPTKGDLSGKRVFEETLVALEEIIERVGQIRSDLENPINSKVISYLEENYHRDLSLEELANHFGISIYQIGRLIKEITNSTFSEYLTHLRIERAKELLREGHLTVKEISWEVGFNSQHYFSRVFKKYVGLTPSEYERGVWF